MKLHPPASLTAYQTGKCNDFRKKRQFYLIDADPSISENVFEDIKMRIKNRLYDCKNRYESGGIYNKPHHGFNPIVILVKIAVKNEISKIDKNKINAYHSLDNRLPIFDMTNNNADKRHKYTAYNNPFAGTFHFHNSMKMHCRIEN